MSLQLRPGLRRVRRGPGRLQLGVDPDLGVVVDGLAAAEERLLDAFDGRSTRAWLREADRLGIPDTRARDLLARLLAAGVVVRGVRAAGAERLVPAALRARWRPDAVTRGLVDPGGDGWAVLAARRTRTVAVCGLGRTGARVAGGLAAAGVGRLVLEDAGRVAPADVAPGAHDPADVGRPRAHAAADLVVAAGAAAVTAPSAARPDLAVLVARDVVDPLRAADLVRDDVPHLAVVLRERDAVIGPLVVPGTGPCLRCVELARSDRDPEWPRLVAQLADLGAVDRGAGPAGAATTGAGPLARPGHHGEDGVLSALAAALAVAQAVTHLDGVGAPRAGGPGDGEATPRAAPASAATSLEIRLPDGLPGLRRWAPHPACGCTWPPPRRARPGARAALG